MKGEKKHGRVWTGL